MRTIETILGEQEALRVPYILRPLRPGNIGWVIARHGTIYGHEYGWGQTIEVLTAEIMTAFVRNFDARREFGWIAERDGENVGCVFIVKEDDETARGLGIGTRLVEECLRFSRRADYKRVTLWTHRVLEGARKIYIAAGFKLTREWTHDDFGKTLVAETWIWNCSFTQSPVSAFCVASRRGVFPRHFERAFQFRLGQTRQRRRCPTLFAPRVWNRRKRIGRNHAFQFLLVRRKFRFAVRPSDASVA